MFNVQIGKSDTVIDLDLSNGALLSDKYNGNTTRGRMNIGDISVGNFPSVTYTTVASDIGAGSTFDLTKTVGAFWNMTQLFDGPGLYMILAEVHFASSSTNGTSCGLRLAYKNGSTYDILQTESCLASQSNVAYANINYIWNVPADRASQGQLYVLFDSSVARTATPQYLRVIKLSYA